MKKLFLAIVVFANIINLMAQSDTTYFDESWDECGKDAASYYRLPLIPSGDGYLVRDFFISGAKQFEGITINQESDEYDGIATWFNENGTTSQVANYVDGVRQGEMLSYDKNGNLLSKGIYKDDEQSEGTFSDMDDNILQLTTISNGEKQKEQVFEINTDVRTLIMDVTYNVPEKTGEATFFDRNGKQVGKVELKDNEPYNGTMIDYGMNPIFVLATLEISDGKYKGPIRYYYINGSMKRKVYFTENPDSPDKEVYYSADGKAIDSLIYESGDAFKGTKIEYFDEHIAQLSEKIERISHYADGELNGAFKEYFVNGKVNFEASYTRGILQGERISYDTLGNKLYVLTFKDGEPWNGVLSEENSQKTYKEGEVTEEKQFYENGKPSLLLLKNVETVFDTLGNVIGRLEYKDGEPYEGNKIEIYYGEIQRESVYSQGVLHKETEYENGKPSETKVYDKEGNFVSGISYYSSGKKQSEETKSSSDYGNNKVYFDIDGKVLGKFTVDEDGNYFGDEFEFDGNRISKHTLYEKGEIVRTREFSDGKLIADIKEDGVSLFYDLVNNKTYQCIYKDGEPFSGTMFEYDSYYKGISKLAIYKNGELDGEFKTYEHVYGEGNKSDSFLPEYEYFYINGKKEGAAKRFNEGKLIESMNYSNDMLDGEYKSYDLDGNLQSFVIYKEDNPVEGILYQYDDYYSELISITTYKNGNQDGEQKYFSDDEPFRVETYDNGVLLKEVTFSQGKEYVLTYTDSEPFEGKKYDGDDYSIQEYKNGKLLSTKTYTDSDLSVLESMEVSEADEKTVTSYFSNGQKKNEMIYKEDEMQKAKSYDFNGKEIANCTFESEMPTSGTLALHSTNNETDYVLIKIDKSNYQVTEYVNGKSARKLQYSKSDSEGEDMDRFLSSILNLFDGYSFGE